MTGKQKETIGEIDLELHEHLAWTGAHPPTPSSSYRASGSQVLGGNYDAHWAVRAERGGTGLSG